MDHEFESAKILAEISDHQSQFWVQSLLTLVKKSLAAMNFDIGTLEFAVEKGWEDGSKLKEMEAEMEAARKVVADYLSELTQKFPQEWKDLICNLMIGFENIDRFLGYKNIDEIKKMDLNNVDYYLKDLVKTGKTLSKVPVAEFKQELIFPKETSWFFWVLVQHGKAIKKFCAPTQSFPSIDGSTKRDALPLIRNLERVSYPEQHLDRLKELIPRLALLHAEPKQTPFNVLWIKIGTKCPEISDPALRKMIKIIQDLLDEKPVEGLEYQPGPPDLVKKFENNFYNPKSDVFDEEPYHLLTGHDRAWAEAYLLWHLGTWNYDKYLRAVGNLKITAAMPILMSERKNYLQIQWSEDAKLKLKLIEETIAKLQTISNPS